MSLGWYLSGYADGEGCFCISFSRSKRHRFGWDIRPSFSVSQNRDRAEILREFRRCFSCGTIRPDRSDKTLKYEVRSIRDLVEKVIPHFKEFPLIPSKRKDFEKFAEACERMVKQEHLTEKGFKEITRLALKVNPGGKKKYPRLEIKI